MSMFITPTKDSSISTDEYFSFFFFLSGVSDTLSKPFQFFKDLFEVLLVVFFADDRLHILLLIIKPILLWIQ